jgi:hypothetical protein
LGFQEALAASGNKIIQQYVAEKRCNLGTAFLFFTTILPAIKGFGSVKFLGSRINR